MHGITGCIIKSADVYVRSEVFWKIRLQLLLFISDSGAAKTHNQPALSTEVLFLNTLGWTGTARILWPARTAGDNMSRQQLLSWRHGYCHSLPCEHSFAGWGCIGNFLSGSGGLLLWRGSDCRGMSVWHNIAPTIDHCC